MRMPLRQESTLHRRKMPISKSIIRVPVVSWGTMSWEPLGAKVLDTCIANLKPQCGISGAKA